MNFRLHILAMKLKLVWLNCNWYGTFQQCHWIMRQRSLWFFLFFCRNCVCLRTDEQWKDFHHERFRQRPRNNPPGSWRNICENPLSFFLLSFVAWCFCCWDKRRSCQQCRTSVKAAWIRRRCVEWNCCWTKLFYMWSGTIMN